LDTLRRLAAAAGRDFSALTILRQGAASSRLCAGSGPRATRLFGLARRHRRRRKVFAVIGVREPLFDFRGQSIEEGIARPRRFAAEVMPPVDR
jgi:hypothetical protein